MTGDANLHLPKPKKRDLWALPEIESLSIERVRYREPRRHVLSGRFVELEEGVEIAVRTTDEIPVRALAPALHVGMAEVAENEQVDATLYRFFVLDEKALEAGAPIALGWVGHPPPTQRAKFRYEPPGERITAER